MPALVRKRIKRLEDLSTVELRRRLAAMEAKRAVRKAASSQEPARRQSRKGISFGSACSGWGTDMQAALELGVDAKHCFACDVASAARKFIQANFQVEKWIDSVFDPAFGDLPYVDFFSAGFPCQPYSTAGARHGVRDSRSGVLSPLLDYITKKKPKVVILENVLALLHAPNKVVHDLIVKTLDNAGYEHYTKVLNSLEHGVPQRRRRVYIVAIRRSALVGQFVWPSAVPTPPLRLFLDKTKQKDSIGKFQRAKIKKGIAQIRTHEGVDPTKSDYIIDIASGYEPVPYAKDVCPTITRSRGMQRGFYYTRQQRRFSVFELARLQGCQVERYDWTSLRPSDIGGLAGNAMTVSVMRSLLPRALAKAGLQ